MLLFLCVVRKLESADNNTAEKHATSILSNKKNHVEPRLFLTQAQLRETFSLTLFQQKGHLLVR